MMRFVYRELLATHRAGLWTGGSGVPKGARLSWLSGTPGFSKHWKPQTLARTGAVATTLPHPEGQDLALILARSPMLDSSALGNQTVCAPVLLPPVSSRAVASTLRIRARDVAHSILRVFGRRCRVCVRRGYRLLCWSCSRRANARHTLGSFFACYERNKQGK